MINSVVSIHAPAGGATPWGDVAKRVGIVSIHAPAGGATFAPRWRKVRVLSFNPRARGGRDLLSCSTTTILECFNPRARGGRDTASLPLYSDDDVSIHAPAGGATPSASVSLFVMCFNPRARGGRDPPCTRISRRLPCFNPRARGGRDRALLSDACVKLKFQSTRPRGARPISRA